MVMQKALALRKSFTVKVEADAPVVVGQDERHGRRQLIPCPSGTVEGDISGTVLPGCVDSQIIRPDGTCLLSARYGIRLADGRGLYIQNDGIRTVPQEHAALVFNGEFVDPSLYYFCTTPKIEAYDESLSWLEEKVFVCGAVRLPDYVQIDYYMLEQQGD